MQFAVRGAALWRQVAGVAVVLGLGACASYPSLDGIEAVKDNNGAKALRIAQKSPSQFSSCHVLYYAAEYCQPAVARAALDAGVPPHCSTGQIADPLWMAARSGCVSVASLLLSRGAQVNFTQGAGSQTPLDAAMVTQQRDMIAYLASQGGRQASSDAAIAKQRQQQLELEAELREIDEAAARDRARVPVFVPTPPVVSAPRPSAPGTGAQPGRGTPRTYCVHPSYERNNRPAPNTLHVTFHNNCPIAVKIGWCWLRADNKCFSGGGSGTVAPGTTFKATATSQEMVRVRHIACAAKATGYNTSYQLAEWYCGPGE